MKWLRLYHDTITDHKWRVVANDSGQPEANVLAVWMHMMINASASSERGTLEGWNDRIVAAALGIPSEAVTAIRDAMQGMVLDGDRLTGWDKRQRQDSDDAAERKRRSRANKQSQTPPTDTSGGHGGNGLDRDAAEPSQDKAGMSRDNTAMSQDSHVTLSRATQTPDSEREEGGGSARAHEIAVLIRGLTELPVTKANVATVEDWLAKNYHPQLDIYPAVLEALPTAKAAIGCFAYFTKAIDRHHATRTSPQPEPSNVLPIRSPAQQHRGHPGRATGGIAQTRLVAREFEIGDFDPDGSGVRAG